MSAPTPHARHRISEASAGTGKTTWITRQAIALLTAARTPLDQILFMTFTERATGDLKARLRAAVENALSDMPEYHQALQAALDSFDRAHVYTIHGFCQRVLLDYPFETGFDFRPTHVDDAELLGGCLRELQRTAWHTQHGEQLAEILKTIGYDDGKADQWEELVMTVTRAYRPACGHILRPEQGDGAPAMPSDKQFAVETILQLQELLRTYKHKRGLISFEDMLTHVADALDPARNRSAALLREALRHRYRIAVVDEFQDTDPLQWRIFKRIFVEGPGRLLVVGDPKQAIFGFLGADVHAYLDAVRELDEGAETSREPLTTNWRTCDALLTPLNRLFERGRWFDGTGIEYTPVAATGDPVHRLVKDESGRAALTLVDLRQDDKLSDAQWTFARFAAAEIDRLLHGPGDQPLLQLKKKEDPEPRPLRAGDISILIRSRRDAVPIERCLRERRIPYSFYKQSGLWQSAEAEQLACLLRTLAAPEEIASLRTALLTTFFRIRPAELAGREELDEDLPAVRLFRFWCGLAARRQWGALFQSLLEDCGVLFAGIEDADYERRLANFRHLVGVLEEAAYGQGLDLVGLIGVLEEKRRSDSGDDPANLQPIETERGKVRIMTMHSAKGDEYPVVFVAGGFTMAKQDRTPTYLRYRDSGKLVIDLETKNAEAKEKNEDAAASEHRRLFYVTLTRAMFKLYLPRLKTKGYRGGSNGPLVKIVVPAIEAAELEKMNHPHVEVVAPDPPAAARSPTLAAEAVAPMLSLPEGLFPAVDADALRRRGIRVRSYSTLRQVHTPAAEAFFAERPAHDDNDQDEFPDDEGPFRGTLFGDLVHDTLEEIDFGVVADCAGPQALLAAGPIRDLLDLVFQKHCSGLPAGERQAGQEQVAKVVWNALQTPLEPLGCRLCEIPFPDRLHELEFHFPELMTRPRRSPPTEGFLTGFMDLVFRREGRYYLLDWKSNDLHGDYSPEALARSMDESDYHRQYRLYTVALQRWLEKRIAGFEFTRDFGGVFYLFVRGMNGHDQSGVFFRRPAPAELALSSILES
jgi:exodeoxyribonuclease V beta subunit